MSRHLLLTLGLVLLHPAPALAQGDDPGPEYQQAMSEGKAAFKASRYQQAAEHFVQAFELSPRANLLFNIGLSYEKAGDALNAITYYSRFVEANPGSRKRPRVQQKLAALQAKLSDKYVEVKVTSSPPGAVIFVDTKSRGAMGAAPLTFKLLPGKYTLIAELADHEPVRKELHLLEGQPETVELYLVATAEVGSLRLMIPEFDADIMVDSRPMGRSPLQKPLRLAAGAHEITVMKEGLETFKRDVTVVAGQTLTLQVSLKGGGQGGAVDPLADGGQPREESGGDPLWAWVTMGVGAAMVAGGALTGLSAQSLHDDLSKKEKAFEPIAEADIDTGNTLTLTTNVLLAGGGAALIGGAVWWFLVTRQPVETRAEIQAMVAPGLGGSAALQVWGTF